MAVEALPDAAVKVAIVVSGWAVRLLWDCGGAEATAWARPKKQRGRRSAEARELALPQRVAFIACCATLSVLQVDSPLDP